MPVEQSKTTKKIVGMKSIVERMYNAIECNKCLIYLVCMCMRALPDPVLQYKIK